MDAASTALAGLWRDAGGPPEDLECVQWSGPRHLLPSVFDVTAAAAASVAAANLAAARLWGLRRGTPTPAVEVDARHAAVAFRSERYLRVDGAATRVWDPVAGDYRAGDGRWIRLHTNFPHHRDIACGVLRAPPERGPVEEAVARWAAEDLERAIVEAGGCAAMMRSTEEWRAHEHGRRLGELPPVEFERIGDAPPETPPPAERPLEGVRVLDLTRVIAGPVCGRFLAACGADVLRVSSADRPDMEGVVIDTGFGKRSTHLDLTDDGDRATFEALVREADVLVQSYRPGALARMGYGAEALAALRPGLVFADLSAYGRVGLWAERRGFDSLVQMVSGIAHAGTEARGVEQPSPLPAQALDHASGYLLAFGVAAALARRAADGGSWRVRVSLARTGRWIEDLGRVDALDVPDPGIEDVADLLDETRSPFGLVRHVRAPGAIEGVPHRWALPPSPSGTHAAAW